MLRDVVRVYAYHGTYPELGAIMTLSKVSRMFLASVCALFVCCLMMFAGCSQSSSSGSASSNAGSSASSEASKAAAEGPYASGIHHAELTVEGYDPITIELNADEAPSSVANFCELAESGYYDGLTIYRFIDKFCMQGGTKGNSAAGNDASLSPIVGEFSQNGYENSLADDFKKGIVAMARKSDPDSATSTFFVTLDTSEQVSLNLNGQYAAFGTIDEKGMTIVDMIVADYLPAVTNPQSGAIEDEAKQAKIVSIKVVD